VTLTAANFVDGNPVVTLTFDKKVLPESGDIILRPYSNWRIPPVLTEAEFSQVYSALNTVDQGKLMQGSQGNPYLGGDGQPVGPYKKITQGLKTAALALNGAQPAGDYWVPDTATKYVLAYDLDLNGDTALGGTLGNPTTQGMTPNALRELFNTAKYLQQTFEVTSTANVKPVPATGNSTDGYTQYTLTFNKPPADGHNWDGRQWEVLIEEGAFHDAAGNTNELSQSYFWSQGTAVPVIRINRYSHDSRNVEPKTKIDVRIDCETPGAAIQYAKFNKSLNTAVWDWTFTESVAGLNNFINGTATANEYADSVTGTPANYVNTGAIPDTNSNRGIISNNFDAAASGTPENDDLKKLSLLAVNAGHPNPFMVGDESLYTARKDYVAAWASRTGDFSEVSVDRSAKSYEGVFKSLVLFKGRAGSGSGNNTNAPSNAQTPKIQGNSQPTGMSVISGFPLKDAPATAEADAFAKYMYFDPSTVGNHTAGNSRWVWVTWEIISDWWEQSNVNGGSYQGNGGTSSVYNTGTYGNFIFRQNQR
jgi:hypothetical protein